MEFSYRLLFGSMAPNPPSFSSMFMALYRQVRGAFGIEPPMTPASDIHQYLVLAVERKNAGSACSLQNIWTMIPKN